MLYTFKVQVAGPELSYQFFTITTDAGNKQAAEDQIESLINDRAWRVDSVEFQSREPGTLYDD